MTATTPGFSADQIPSSLRTSIRRKLLHWYDGNKRDLPWRRRPGDPYAQWVAEIMLQQTRVDTVIGYYDRFMRRFPTVQALARASDSQVLKSWEGLGYYRRVLYFHRAAKLICEAGGAIPGQVDQLQKLPGVGEYTAAAIASIAFGKAEAAVDGNVERVLARLFSVPASVRSVSGKAAIRSYAKLLLAKKRPGDFNQAWMDLGSHICTPRTPDCARCPVNSVCQAYRNGTVSDLPNRTLDRERKPKPVTYVTIVFVCSGKLLVRRRAIGGLWSGLWEFPTLECHGRPLVSKAVGLLAEGEMVLPSGRITHCGKIEHQLTHRSLTFHIYVVRADHADSANTNIGKQRWVTPRSFRGLAVSTAHRRIYTRCQDQIEAAAMAS